MRRGGSPAVEVAKSLEMGGWWKGSRGSTFVGRRDERSTYRQRMKKAGSLLLLGGESNARFTLGRVETGVRSNARNVRARYCG